MDPWADSHTLSISAFSIAASSGMAMKHLHPTAELSMARLTPVLPAVPSVMRPPFFNLPDANPSWMIFSATLSFTLPPGFVNSAFARICMHEKHVKDFSAILYHIIRSAVNFAIFQSVGKLFLFSQVWGVLHILQSLRNLAFRPSLRTLLISLKRVWGVLLIQLQLLSKRYHVVHKLPIEKWTVLRTQVSNVFVLGITVWQLYHEDIEEIVALPLNKSAVHRHTLKAILNLIMTDCCWQKPWPHSERIATRSSNFTLGIPVCEFKDRQCYNAQMT